MPTVYLPIFTKHKRIKYNSKKYFNTHTCSKGTIIHTPIYILYTHTYNYIIQPVWLYIKYSEPK